MADIAIPEDQQAIQAQIQDARRRADQLKERLRKAEAEIAARDPQRQQYRLLGEICGSLERLHELGGAHLFWEDGDGNQSERLAQLRWKAATFEAEIARMERGRDVIRRQIAREENDIDLLVDELSERREEEELRQFDYVIERENVELPYHPPVMPWAKRGEDEKRFRIALLSTLLFSLVMTFLMSLWTVTPPEVEKIEIPERLARLVKKDIPKPVEPKREEPKIEEPKPEDKKTEKKEPTVAEKKQARKKAESAGLMAFKNSFTELREMTQPELGADARISDAGKKSTGQLAQRSLITAQAQAGASGINTSSLSRNVAGIGRQGGGVEFSRVESSIGTDFKEGDRPLSEGPGPSRTDEEIQIVFDRYKAALYRIYNRELRNDPTLRGKMVLRITIEPDGSVSLCKVESTDLASPTLVDEIVARVSRFNFGPKEGVPTITILYPIDFLPAN